MAAISRQIAAWMPICRSPSSWCIAEYMYLMATMLRQQAAQALLLEGQGFCHGPWIPFPEHCRARNVSDAKRELLCRQSKHSDLSTGQCAGLVPASTPAMPRLQGGRNEIGALGLFCLSLVTVCMHASAACPSLTFTCYHQKFATDMNLEDAVCKLHDSESDAACVRCWRDICAV